VETIFQTGVNWAAFKSNSDGRISVGVPGSNETGPVGTLRNSNDMLSGVPGSTLKGSGGLFGLVFQTNSFAAMLSFLESQGSVQVLSSPRISTLNNQKAVLKVGSEDYYVTSVTSGTSISTTGTTTTTQPTPTIQQFFSGITMYAPDRSKQHHPISNWDHQREAGQREFRTTRSWHRPMTKQTVSCARAIRLWC
jgi:MSHA biogenesis protein MshL